MLLLCPFHRLLFPLEIPMEGLSEWIKEFNAIKPKEEEEFINKKENKVINEDAIQNQKSLIMEKLQEVRYLYILLIDFSSNYLFSG